MARETYLLFLGIIKLPGKLSSLSGAACSMARESLSKITSLQPGNAATDGKPVMN